MVKVDLNKLDSRNYVKLNNESIRYLNNMIRKTGLLLDKNTKDSIYRMTNGKKISLQFLKKIKRLLDLPPEYLYNNINLITSIKNTDVGIRDPRLPFDFGSAEGIRFIAAMMGDGELNSQKQARYNNQSKKLVDIIIKSTKKVFGNVDLKVYYRKDKTYQLHLPKIVGLIIRRLGIKPGGKALADNSIPSFIFKTNNKFKAVFIRQFFDDEGNVRVKDRRLQIKQTISNKTDSKRFMKSNPEKYCPRVLSDLKELLADLDISSRISLGAKRDNKSDWELSIYGKDNLERFQKYVGFDLGYKNKLLAKCIKSYKFPSAPRNQRIEFAIEKCRETQEKHEYITRHLLAKESKRSVKTATYYMIDLRKKEILKRISAGKYILTI